MVGINLEKTPDLDTKTGLWMGNTASVGMGETRLIHRPLVRYLQQEFCGHQLHGSVCLLVPFTSWYPFWVCFKGTPFGTPEEHRSSWVGRP